jgi:hypothetical protein
MDSNNSTEGSQAMDSHLKDSTELLRLVNMDKVHLHSNMGSSMGKDRLQGSSTGNKVRQEGISSNSTARHRRHVSTRTICEVEVWYRRLSIMMD